MAANGKSTASTGTGTGTSSRLIPGSNHGGRGRAVEKEAVVGCLLYFVLFLVATWPSDQHLKLLLRFCIFCNQLGPCVSLSGVDPKKALALFSPSGVIDWICFLFAQWTEWVRCEQSSYWLSWIWAFLTSRNPMLFIIGLIIKIS